MKKLFRRLFAIWILFLVICLAQCGTSTDKIYPTRSGLTESVYSSVTVQPDSLYQVYAAVGGILEKNLVEEGDKVRKGDPIAQIVNNTPLLNMENARLNLELARENYSGNNAVLSSMRDEINSARLKLQNDSANYYRQKKLWDQKIGSEVEYDNRKLAFELSSSNLQLLVGNYERMKNELKTKLIQAENNYKTATIASEDFTVTSKINGTVYELFKNQGELVSSQEPVAAVGSSDKFVIEMLVDEVDIVKIREGQKALITLDAYNTEVFEARINKIYPLKDERSQTFKIEALFIDAPEVLYPGLAGEGNIIIMEKKDVITIPKDYLFDGNKVKTEDGIIEVRTGIENLDRVEIISGLDTQTHILKPGE
ncbi:efflux RND transporter periplasmic adaptor subunit [Lentiprolixibacter aurantiacus]|uniref:Efflux RND transporter periplasmic adaptor subunit n=1 Tax=Lentiprolixibacter aurantiacus TaxID=2993939 RepID=A0AAE3SNY0_9FLAO|nr:efflux RND transporter periplasmic adaptor subunit [Lentiprolixibacter aurantiacus]MCX2720119.1 efflux RND transporter periplasmic adaptor subunit [Lentiprolixibacter aurantiacus]